MVNSLVIKHLAPPAAKKGADGNYKYNNSCYKNKRIDWAICLELHVLAGELTLVSGGLEGLDGAVISPEKQLLQLGHIIDR